MTGGETTGTRWQRIQALTAWRHAGGNAIRYGFKGCGDPIVPAADPAWASAPLEDLHGNTSHELGELERFSLAAVEHLRQAIEAYGRARHAKAKLAGLELAVRAITAPPEDRAIIYRVYVDGCHVDTVEYRADRSRSFVLEALTAAGYPGATVEELHEPDGEREGQDADASEHRAGLHGQ